MSERIAEALSLIRRGTDEIISEEELRQKLSSKKPLRIKFGVDPTAPDIHLGHTVLLKKLRTFQDLGHQAILIIGDFTARIGDPSGRSNTRPVLDEKEIKDNARTYTEQVFKILDKEKTELCYNSQWLYPLGINGLLELSRHSTVAQMLHRADFRQRYESNVDITMLEFLYPLLQGYDSVVVQADVELGGTDQKFNLLMGRQIQEKYGQSPQVVITMPLLLGLDGVRKMSKSYKNHVALNDPPEEMFGKIMSITDEMMPDYYNLLTDKDLSVIKQLHPRQAKLLLAETIVNQYHGAGAARLAREHFENVFSHKGRPEKIPEFVVKNKSMMLSDLLLQTHLAPSRREARRLIQQGAVDIDDRSLPPTDKGEAEIFFDTPEKIIKVGKRKFCKIIYKE